MFPVCAHLLGAKSSQVHLLCKECRVHRKPTHDLYALGILNHIALSLSHQCGLEYEYGMEYSNVLLTKLINLNPFSVTIVRSPVKKKC